MNVEEFPEDSDSSDEDYVPGGKGEEVVSEVESDGDSEEPLSGSDDKGTGRKRSKKLKKLNKRAKTEGQKPVDENGTEQLTEDDKKKKADDLWADFMKDTGFTSKNSQTVPSNTQSKTQQTPSKKNDKGEENKTERPKEKVKITQIFEFAGEEVKVEKEVDPTSAEARLLSKEPKKTNNPKSAAGLSGIGSVLSIIGKKQKISTLEKSKLDWDRFKKDENIEEELETFNKGKDGYLERQDFLQRADLRRFEIEKNMRNVERAKRFNSSL